MSVATEAATEVEYHPQAQPFSAILEQIFFEYKDTVRVTEGGLEEQVEIWEKSTKDGSTEVTIGYTSGKVLVKKYIKVKGGSGKADRERLNVQKEFRLTSEASMEVAARAAI